MKKYFLILLALSFLSAGCEAALPKANTTTTVPDKKVEESTTEKIRVTGSAMKPGFSDGEYILIDKQQKNHKRGDVIVFKFPKDPSQLFIKRIVGMPGETVEISANGMLINGKTLDESAYLGSEVRTLGLVEKITLAADEYYVLGDNRTASSDSRVWGPLKENLIVGTFLNKATPN